MPGCFSAIGGVGGGLRLCYSGKPTLFGLEYGKPFKLQHFIKDFKFIITAVIFRSLLDMN